MKKNPGLLLAVALVSALATVRAADITGTITLNGTPPPEREITPLTADATCGKLRTTPAKTQFYVVGSKGELADVVVSIKGMSGKSTGASAPAAVMDQVGCLYTPTILAVQTNQKIQVKNSDPVMHNVHPMPSPTSGNKEANQAQMQGGAPITFTFEKPEMFLKFACNVHTWMFAWVSVFDHPYFALSGKDGTFKIASVPPGKYTLEAHHRKGGVVSKEVEVKDQNVTADFTVEAK